MDTKKKSPPPPSHLDDVSALAAMIARARGRETPTPFDVRIARDRLAPRIAA